MHIRPATRADVPAIAKIGVKAFGDDTIYNHFFPWRFEYPHDFYRYFEEEIRTTLVSVGELIMVTVTDDKEKPFEGAASPSVGTIVAYAIYVRSGNPEGCDLWNPDSYSKKIWRMGYSLLGYWNSIFFPNRAIYLPAMEEFNRQATAIYAENTDPKTGRLEFDTLAVDPAYQRRGYGDKLMEYIGMRAWEENIIGLGVATTQSLPLYLRNGCEEVGRIVMPERVLEYKGKPDMAIKLDRVEISVLKWQA